MPLLQKLSERSNGIFLWASLVIGQLLHKLSLGEDVSTLEKHLDDTPQDISELYHQMIKFIEPTDYDRALRMFWMAICYSIHEKRNALPLIAITWVDNMFEDNEFPPSCPIRTYSPEEIEERQRSAELQINYYTKGLLETQARRKGWSQEAFPEVVFLHRTVYDFVRDSEALQQYVSNFACLSEVSAKIRLSFSEL